MQKATLLPAKRLAIPVWVVTVSRATAMPIRPYRVPKLGGQKAPYLVVAIKGYREGTRVHPTMTAQASSLTDQQIEDIAAYLASVSAETV